MIITYVTFCSQDQTQIQIITQMQNITDTKAWLQHNQQSPKQSQRASTLGDDASSTELHLRSPSAQKSPEITPETRPEKAGVVVFHYRCKILGGFQVRGCFPPIPQQLVNDVQFHLFTAQSAPSKVSGRERSSNPEQKASGSK